MQEKEIQTTTIRIHPETIKLINSFKLHPRETYEGVIMRLVEEHAAALKRRRK